MAMTTPRGFEIPAFDKSNGATFEFITSGGNQVIGNILRVYEGNILQYEHSIGSSTAPHYSFDNEVEPNILTNGVAYNYTIQTFDINNNLSNESEPIGFWCFNTPTVNFTNVDTIINTSSYEFEVNVKTGQILNTDEYELVNSIKYDLYEIADIQGNPVFNLVDTSGVLYGIDDGTRESDGSFYTSYTFDNLENNDNDKNKKEYRIICTIETQNRTIADQYADFRAQFAYPNVFSAIELENHCDDGYISITSNTSTIDGISYPSPPEYIDNNSVYLINQGHYVKWDKDFTIPSDFLLRLKVSIGRLNEPFCILGNKSSGNYFELVWVREQPTIDNDVYDYIVFKGYQNNVLKVLKKSNTLTTLLNNLDDLFVWVKKVDNSYELIIKRINDIITPTTFQWIEGEGVGNVVYERNSTLIYDNSFVSQTTSTEIVNDIDIFPIKNVEIMNGIFSLIDVTNNTDEIYDPTESLTPIWTYDTILNCNFHNNINAGSLEQMNVIRVLVQRRLANELGKYITIADIPITQVSDLSFTIRDYFVPSGVDLEYLIVPISIGDIFGDRISAKIRSMFNAIHISDTTQSFRLFEGFAYGTISKNIPRGIYQTLGSKYPTIVQNGVSNYYSGSVSGKLMGYDYMETRKVDYQAVTKQAREFLEFLSTNTAKVITDWRGNIWVCRVTDNPNMNEENGGVINISFSFDEQGKWDNQEDLIENGLIKV